MGAGSTAENSIEAIRAGSTDGLDASRTLIKNNDMFPSRQKGGFFAGAAICGLFG